MAKPSRIELLKQKLLEEKEKKESGGGSNFPSTIWPFWSMDTGDSARVRILADLNEDNPYIFFIDRLEHTISLNGEDKKIPCRAMYGEECPICTLSRKYYKEDGKDSKNGKYYYRKKTSLVRVLVLEDPLPPNKDTGETAVGKVFNTQFGYQLMEKIKEQISSDDLGDFFDLEDGTDFIIKKSPQGDYGTYSIGSQFARKSTAIESDVADEVELIDLSTLLPKDLGYDAVHNMLQAHLTGDDYVEDGDAKQEAAEARRKDSKSDDKSKTTTAKTSEKTVEKKVDKKVVEDVNDAEQEEEAEADSTSDDGDEDDILARIRARKNASAKK